MGFFSDLLGKGQKKETRKANAQAKADLAAGYSKARAPLADMAATGAEDDTFYRDALGLNGAEARARAQGVISSDPLWQGQLADGQNAMLRMRNARGGVGAGKTLLAGQRVLTQQYGNWLDRYEGRANQGQQARVNLSNLDYGYGATKAGQAVQHGNAMVQARNSGVNNVLNLVGTLAGAGKDMAKAYAASDRRLKRDIVRTGELPSGLPTYRFKYVWGDEEYEGVMADEAIEIFPEAVAISADGFQMVDYSRIG